MMGGGSDIDEAFRWLCQKATAATPDPDASGDDAYNPYINGLCKLNSVATLSIPDRKLPAIQGGGDYSPRGSDLHHRRRSGGLHPCWKGTPVEDAINANIAAGKPIGGTSAGLASSGSCLRRSRRQARRQGPRLHRRPSQSLF